MDQGHRKRVAHIADQVAAFYKSKTPFRIYRGATNSTRTLTFEKDKMIDVQHLDHILSIDAGARQAIVEPNVPMDALVKATLKYDLVPPVVMEFPGITVGGGLQGGAGESSSYKWGTFNRTLDWYEVILADGRIVRAEPSGKYADLYWGIPGTYGSLGVVTKAAVQLIPAKPYVAVTYIPVHNFAEAVRTLQACVEQRPDFIDGIMFSHQSGVVIIGTMQDQPTAAVRTFRKAADQWFYLHAQTMIKHDAPTQDSIPIWDYLFRYDRGAFWTGASVFKHGNLPFNRFTRWLFDPLLHTRKMYEALQASGMAQQCIIQDLALPKNTAVEFMDYVDQRFGIYPLWLCPMFVDDKSPFLSSHLQTGLAINVGVWGLYPSPHEAFVAANKELESTVRRLGGKKWLYAHAYYDEKTFWSIYPKHAYLKLRKHYDAAHLPSVYDKTRVKERRSVSIKRGLLFALLGKSGISQK